MKFEDVDKVLNELDTGVMPDPHKLEDSSKITDNYLTNVFRASTLDELRSLLWRIKRDMAGENGDTRQIQAIASMANIRMIHMLGKDKKGISKELLRAGLFASVSMSVNMISLVSGEDQGEVFMEFMTMVTDLMNLHPKIIARIVQGPTLTEEEEAQEVLGDGFVMTTTTKH